MRLSNNEYLCSRRSMQPLKLAIMKKCVMLLVALLTAVSGAFAQRDGVFHRPKKENKTDNTKKDTVIAYNYSDAYGKSYYDDGYSEEEIDAYNRRYVSDNDTLYLGDADDGQSSYDGEYEQSYYGNDYEYTSRMARFHSPSINIYYGFGSPFYWDYYDYAWGWGPYYDPWYCNAYWGWSWSWHHPHYYGWAWYHRPYYNWAWHRPWYGGGPRYGYGGHGYGGRLYAGQVHSSRVGSAGGRIWTSGRNYRDAGSNSGTTGVNSRRTYTYRSNGNGLPQSSGNRNSTVRSYGNRNSTTNNGTYNRSSSTNNNSSTSNAPSTTTRSFGSGSSVGSTRSMGGSSVRSGGGSMGGTRSFGGGGGRRR